MTEGNAGTTVANFTVTLSAQPGATPVTVNYATGNGTAVAPGDYTAIASGSLTFSGTTTTQTIPVTVVGDTTVEPAETFTVTLSSPVGATLADGVATGTISNDDVPPPTQEQTSRCRLPAARTTPTRPAPPSPRPTRRCGLARPAARP